VNHPPTAEIDGTGFTGFTDETLSFDASESTDEDGEIVSYLWDFGDGTTASGKIASHHYSTPGEYTVKLTVTDDTDANDSLMSTAVIIQANRPPSAPEITGETELKANTKYSFTIVSDDLDGDFISYEIDWGDETTDKTDFVNNETSVIFNHSWSAAGKYDVEVRSYDNQTYSATSVLTVYVDAQSITGLLTGLLLDEDGDGIYDSFLNSVKNKKFPIEQADDGSYQIDANGDGTWDYTFDLFKGLNKIEIPDDLTTNNTPGFTILILLISALLMIIISQKKKP
jgi:PKD repeat protein